MKLWWKRLLMLLTIPFLAVALTACPGPEGNGADADEPAIEGEAAPDGEDAEDEDAEDDEAEDDDAENEDAEDDDTEDEEDD